MPHQSRELCFTWAIFAGSSTPSSASGKSQICHTEDEKFAIIEKDFANTVLRNECTVNLWVTLREMKKAHYTQPVSVWQGQSNLCQVPSLQALPKTMEEGKQTNIESVQSSYSKSAWLAWKHKQKPEHNQRSTEHQGLFPCSNALVHIQRLKWKAVSQTMTLYIDCGFEQPLGASFMASTCSSERNSTGIEPLVLKRWLQKIQSIHSGQYSYSPWQAATSHTDSSTHVTGFQVTLAVL